MKHPVELAAQRESARCLRNVERGGSCAFWEGRLLAYVVVLERSARLIRERLEWLEDVRRDRAGQVP